MKSKKYYLPLLSAILLASVIIPYHLLVTHFIFLIPFLFFIRGLDGWKDAVRGGVWFGLPLYLIATYWLYALLKISFLTLFLYLASALYLTVFLVLFALIAYLFHKKGRLPFFLFVPFLWLVLEHVKNFGPFRLTGLHVHNSMAVYPSLIQFIDITGPYGIGFWLLLVNALIFEAIVSYRSWKRLIAYSLIAAVLIIAPVLYSLHQWRTLQFDQDLKISMVQPNIPLEKKLSKEYDSENMTVIQSIISQAIKQKPDLLVWPETSFPFPVQHWLEKSPAPSLPEISALALYSSTPMLIGAEYARIKSREDFDIYNAALLMDARGNILDYYGKMYLVPFAEAVPFGKLLGLKRLGKKGLLAKLGGFTPGEKLTIFEFEKRKKQPISPPQAKEETTQSAASGDAKVRFGVQICYEGLYPDLSRKLRIAGADFLVCITNDAWFGKTWFPGWHATALRMRAIENRASIIRCGNTGVSSFYDPAGRMYQTTEIFTKAIVSGFIATKGIQTIYTRCGDVIIYISYSLLIILTIFSFISRRKA